MRGFAFQLFNLWHLLKIALSACAIGAFSFNNSWFTADEEYWTVSSISTDTTGTMTFINKTYALAPEIILVPLDTTFYGHQFSVGTATGVTAVINQITVAGTGVCGIIVRRRK